MRTIVIRMAVGLLLILIALTPADSVIGRPSQLPAACEEFAFSTEEDFVTQGPEPPGGNIISDGDLLSTTGGQCIVCARNADLLEIFQIPYDLGLDAADVVNAEISLVAFSTELNSPNRGQFTAGDLLVTNGVIIRNQALTQAWQIVQDIGLDAIHFIGDPAAIIAFLEDAAALQQPISAGQLAELFAKYPSIDIWFSTSGTRSVAGAPGFLDGDLLSAAKGTIVAANSDLLPSNVPAGLPNRGVDFGLDAATGDRAGSKEQIHYSTELLFDGDLAFTDGDVLRYGNGVVATNAELVACLEPFAKFVGLDALHMTLEGPPPGSIHGTKYHDLNANGIIDPGDPGLVRWEIHLDGTDNTGTDFHEVTYTDSSGVYSFTVPAGSYTVSEVCPPDWYQSIPTPPEGCGSGVHDIDLAPGESVTDVDFGNYQYIEKTGAKFYDRDQNGNWDQEEPPLGQWEIHLDGVDGTNHSVNLVTWTDGGGYYTFTVPPGSYVVSEVCPPGWAQTKPTPENDCGTGTYPFAPVSGELPHTVNDFGNFELTDIYLPVILRDHP